jgi:hypothetical protein
MKHGRASCAIDKRVPPSRTATDKHTAPAGNHPLTNMQQAPPNFLTKPSEPPLSCHAKRHFSTKLPKIFEKNVFAVVGWKFE